MLARTEKTLRGKEVLRVDIVPALQMRLAQVNFSSTAPKRSFNLRLELHWLQAAVRAALYAGEPDSVLARLDAEAQEWQQIRRRCQVRSCTKHYPEPVVLVKRTRMGVALFALLP